MEFMSKIVILNKGKQFILLTVFINRFSAMQFVTPHLQQEIDVL